MKVWGTNIFWQGEQRRAVVAAKSQKEAARLFGVSLYELRNYASETGNEVEVRIASESPGRVCVKMGDVSGNPEREPWLTLHEGTRV